MKNTCILLSILTYEDGSHYSRCRYRRWTNNQEAAAYDVPLAEALDMMWTMKKLGGRKRIDINQYDHTICTRSVMLFMET